MKFRGSGNEVLKKFYDEYKKTREFNKSKKFRLTPQQIEKVKIRAKQLIASHNSVFSHWEEKVRKKLRASNVEFETKFRKFPLYIDGEKIYDYVPDFVLKNREINKKRILIEVHEYLTEEIALKHGAFMETYDSQYYMIMIVSDNELRKWNEWESSNHKLYDDVWTLNDLNFFVNSLTKYESSSNKDDKLKNSKSRNEVSFERLKPSKTVLCIGCKNFFETIEYEQLYCSTCLNKL